MRTVMIWMGLLSSLLLGVGLGEFVVSQELPPEIRADQYLGEGHRAVEAHDLAAALKAFAKLEALPVTPPVEFFYWYGRTLVEHGLRTDSVADVNKGEGHLTQYILAAGREAERYRSALEWLSRAEGEGLPRPKTEEAKTETKTAEATTKTETEQAEAKPLKCDGRLWGDWDCAPPFTLSSVMRADGVEEVTLTYPPALGFIGGMSIPLKIDAKWHPDANGAELAATCNNTHSSGFRALTMWSRAANDRSTVRRQQFFIDDAGTMWTHNTDLNADFTTQRTYQEVGCLRD